MAIFLKVCLFGTVEKTRGKDADAKPGVVSLRPTWLKENQLLQVDFWDGYICMDIYDKSKKKQ